MAASRARATSASAFPGLSERARSRSLRAPAQSLVTLFRKVVVGRALIGGPEPRARERRPGEGVAGVERQRFLEMLDGVDRSVHRILPQEMPAEEVQVVRLGVDRALLALEKAGA